MTTKRGRPRKKKADPVPAGPRYPAGTTHLSPNARDWFKVKNPPKRVKYARTDKGEHFRIHANTDWSQPGMHCTKVTKAHIEYMAREVGAA